MARRPRKTATRSEPSLRLNNEMLLTAKNHEKLLRWIQERLEFANETRAPLVDRFEIIDRQISGYIKHTRDDRKRQRDNERGESPKPTDINLTLVLMQIDEFVTYLLSVMAPDAQIYEAITTAEKQSVGNAFASVMNEHAHWFRHYNNMAYAFANMAKFNFGGFAPIEWRKVFGNRALANETGNLEIQRGVVVREGNALDAFDPYNILFDPSVDPVDLNINGEFFALVDVHTPFRIKKMLREEQIFNIEEKELGL